MQCKWNDGYILRNNVTIDEFRIEYTKEGMAWMPKNIVTYTTPLIQQTSLVWITNITCIDLRLIDQHKNDFY